MRTVRLSSSLLCVLGLLLLGAVGVASAAGIQERPREPFFPRSGNVGYDVKNYRGHLSYRPGSGRLEASVRILAKAEQRLRRFSLDLVGLRVTKVTVNRAAAEFNRGRGKLKVRPARALKQGAPFVIEVSYKGRPRRITDPDGSQEGWYRTDDGALAVGEPVGTAAWLPSNNVPADKASFQIAITVPKALRAVSNGRLLDTERAGNLTTYVWQEDSPMSTYLAVVDIGRGRLERTEAAGLPTWNLIDPRLEKDSRPVVDQLGEVIRFESSVFGPYPFDSAGSIVDYAPKLGYALETQSRPIYAFPPDLSTFVHETAHQWFGDSVGLRRWPNIWLNEGFATWTQWYYAERHSGRSARAIFNRLYRVPASFEELWEPPSGHPGTPQNLFATSTYVRGAMALEALRIKVGTKPMLKILRRWVTENRYGSADIKDFVALSEQVSGENLGPLFQRWLYKRGKP